jgi:hypothetical protein
MAVLFAGPRSGPLKDDRMETTAAVLMRPARQAWDRS